MINTQFPTDPRVLTPTEVKTHLHIGKNAAYNLFANDMTFPSFRIGRKHYIMASEYVRWLERQGTKIKYTPYGKRKPKK